MLIPFSEVISKYSLKPKGILHIGAWDGIEFQDYAAAGVTNVVFIEAQKSIMPTLLGRIAGYPNAAAFNYCVSDKEEDVIFNVTNNGQSSSVLSLGTHETEHPEVSITHTIPMRTITMENIFKKERLPVDGYDFVNADIQGNELRAIKGMGDIISHVNCFYLEVNRAELYRDCALVEEVDDYLKSFGFYRAETKWTAHNWGDAAYVRK